MPADYGAGPTLSPESEVARTIVFESSRYWRSIVTSVAESVVWYLVALGVGRLAFLQMNVNVNAGISGSAALAALGVLGTIVVALQVAVRSSPQSPTAAEGIAQLVARQRGLELFARTCAVAAVAVAGSVVIEYWPKSEAAWNILPLLGSIAGALLVAGLAADASNASTERWAGPLTEVKKAITISEHENALMRLDRASVNSSLHGALIRGISWCVGVPILTAAVLAASGGRITSALSVLTTSVIVFIWIYASVLLFRLGVLTRQLGWALTGAGYFLFVLVWIPVSVTLTASKSPGLPPWAAALICVAYLTVPVIGAFVAVTRLGSRRGSAAVLITWFIESRLRRLEAERSEKGFADERFWSGISCFGALILPLILFPVAQYRLAATIRSLYGSLASRPSGPATPWTLERTTWLRTLERRWRTAGWVALGSAVAHAVLSVVIVVCAVSTR